MYPEDRIPHGGEAEEKSVAHAAEDPLAVRRAKLDGLRARGVEPYVSRFEVSSTAAVLVARYGELEPGEETGETVRVAGRLVAKRDQGKAAFLVIRDASGDLQLFCRMNVLGEVAFESVRDLDLGDWIGATGEVLRTRRGELSVSPTEVTLLSKSLRKPR